jgi:hypothetical protein
MKAKKDHWNLSYLMCRSNIAVEICFVTMLRQDKDLFEESVKHRPTIDQTDSYGYR